MYYFLNLLKSKIIRHGRPTHSSSLKITSNPHIEKNRFIPIGETSMGLYPKKYLVLSKGIKNPTPFPPFVSASNILWESVAKKMTLGSSEKADEHESSTNSMLKN